MDVFAEKTLNLAEIIADRRKALGWTQERMANYLGITTCVDTAIAPNF